jgi:hypothetical protein
MTELERHSIKTLLERLSRLQDDLKHACEVGELCPKCHSRFRRDPKKNRGIVYLNCPNPHCQTQIVKEIPNAKTVSD